MNEWIFRDIPMDRYTMFSKKMMLTWLAETLGLVSPTDRRKGALKVLDVLFERFALDEKPTFKEIYDAVRKSYLEKGEKPPTEEAIRHHLRRMIRIGFLRKERGRYHLNTLYGRDPGEAIESVYRSLETLKEKQKEIMRRVFEEYKM